MATGYLEELFNEIWERTWTSESVLVEILKNRIENHGIFLTEEQLQNIRKQITSPSFNGIHFDLSVEQEKQIRTHDETVQELDIDLSDIDLSDAKLENVANEALTSFLEKVSDVMLNDWKSKHQSILALEREESASFNENVKEIWDETLDLLESLINICADAVYVNKSETKK